MIEAAVCSPDFVNFLTSVIYPLAGYAAVLTGIIIAVVFMVGEASSNPKLTVWSKTEIVQLFASIVSLLLLSSVFGFFCTLDMKSVAELFGLNYPGPTTMFNAAQSYLVGAATYSHNALTVIRYHLEGYTVLAAMGLFKCTNLAGDTGGSVAVMVLPFLSGCGYGETGDNLSPFGGYAAMNGALTMIFNSVLMSYLMSLNYLMILLYVYKGFAFFLFPIAIFIRSMPYMRGLGSILIAVAISFTIVYPFFLAVFDIMAHDALFNRTSAHQYLSDPSLSEFLDESVYPETSGALMSLGGAFDEDKVYDRYFPSGDKGAEAIAFGGLAFIAGFFLPSIALLAAIATTTYLARLFGEEIDLSRIMQMV